MVGAGLVGILLEVENDLTKFRHSHYKIFLILEYYFKGEDRYKCLLVIWDIKYLKLAKEINKLHYFKGGFNIKNLVYL